MAEGGGNSDNRKVINALSIEDDAFSVAILRYHADNMKKYKLNIHHTVTLEESLNFLDNHPEIEIIFLDYRVKSQITGLEILQHIRAKNIKVPVIIITASGDEWIAVRMMKAGASDYLVKGEVNTEILEKAVDEALAHYREFENAYAEDTRERILMDMAIKASLSGVCLMDAEGVVTYVNDSFLAITGYDSQDEVVGSCLRDFFVEPPKFDEIRTRLGGKGGWHGDVEMKKKDGTKFVAEALFSCTRRENNKCVHQIISSFIDVSRIKEEEKRREDLYRGIMEVFALKAEEVGNVETAGHIRRIAAYTKLIAERLRETEAFKYYIDDTYIKDLSYASMLHDVGKWRTPNEILLKPTDLTPAEWEIIKQHPRLGVEMLSPLLRQKGSDRYLRLVESVVLYHHENWDGSGYPEGKKGEEIPLSARIVAIADVYDALTSPRSYRKQLTHEEAMHIMREEKHKFDPRIWKVFEENHEEFKKIRENIK